jgi:hypothetical protein
MIRMTVLLASLCSSLYFAPALIEKLRGGQGATDMLMTQYLPAEAKARLEEIEASGGLVVTDKGVEVPQCLVEVKPQDGAAPPRKETPRKKVHTAGGKTSKSGARTVRGGS